MKTFAMTLDLQDDPIAIGVYRTAHAAVWPSVARALRAIGIRRMKIFMRSTRLFMLFEAPDGFDPAAAFAVYRRFPLTREWERRMRLLQSRVPGSTTESWWVPMDEVFDLDTASLEAPEPVTRPPRRAAVARRARKRRAS